MPSVSLDELVNFAVRTVPEGQSRDGQLTMARQVAESIETGKHLLVQAGTGTGKSLAYLVPALRSGSRTVIATATVMLQTQLVRQDLPRLVEGLAPTLGRRPTFALLKGRHHYICRAKLDTQEADTLFDDGPVWLGEAGKLGTQVKAIREWAETTETGDRADLEPGVNDTIWRHVSMPANECVGAMRCPFGTDCFPEEARHRAREADIIVTNHSLLAMDIAQGGNILPEHDLLIVDEAHELASYATNAAAASLSAEAVARAGRSLNKIVDADTRDRLLEASEDFGEILSHATPAQLDAESSPLTDAVITLAAAARDAMTEVSKSGRSDSDIVATTQARQALRTIVETADRIVANAKQDVIWVAGDENRRRAIHVAPLSVSGLLREGLYKERTVILTSATLSIGGTFDHVAAELGLPRIPQQREVRNRDGVETLADSHAEELESVSWQGIDVGSPFDYPRQAILYVAASLPRPTASGLSDASGKEFVELVRAAGGRTLGLFSSRRAAEQAAELLRDVVDYPVLMQGDDELASLVRRFRDDPRTCLLGVASLWQGIDAPGDGCQLVVIDRLPFPRPDDPLMSARARAADEQGHSGFMSVSVPHAAVRLAQGAGRLIRAAGDRGVVAVLDSRLHHGRYGAFMRQSLPPFWYTTDGQRTREALTRLDAAAREKSGA